MAKVVNKSSSSSRRKQQYKKSRIKHQNNPATKLSNNNELSPSNQFGNYRTVSISLSVILFLAGILLIAVPFFVSSNGVPAALPILGAVCLLLCFFISLCGLCRRRLTRSCYDHDERHSQGISRDHELGFVGGDKANTSYDSEMVPQAGCLQSTPKMFRFHNKPSQQQYCQRDRGGGYQGRYGSKQSNISPPQRPLNNARTFVVNETRQQRRNVAEQNNAAFVPDDDNRQVVVNKKTNHNSANIFVLQNDDPAMQLNNYPTQNITNSRPTSGSTSPSQQPIVLQRNELSDKFNTSREVNVDEDFDENENLSVKSANNSCLNFAPENEESWETHDSNVSNNHTSFISPQMKDNFQKSGKQNKDVPPKSKQTKSKSGSIFSSFKKTKRTPSFKTKPKLSRLSQAAVKGQENPGLEFEEPLSTPSVVLTPPTPSPEVPNSHVSPPSVKANNSVVTAPWRPLVSKTIISSSNKQQRGGQTQQTKSNLGKQYERKSPPREQEVKTKPPKKLKKEKKRKSDSKNFPIEILLNDISDEEDPAVVLAEAVIAPPSASPMPPSNQEVINNDTNIIERKFKRKVELKEVPVPNEVAKKSSNIFKMFKSSDEKPRKKAKDDLMMTENSVKDVYITGNYGQESGTVDNDDDHSPPVVHFKNLAADPDLKGMRFKNVKEVKKYNSQHKDDCFDETFEESESGFSDILKFMRKGDKGSGKIKKKKNKKASSSHSRSESQPHMKSKSINEINKMLVSMTENKSSDLGSSTMSSSPSVDQKKLESSLFVSYNPGGRLNRRQSGSLESFGSLGGDSVASSGSFTGSTGSASSIMNPVRSSMKKPRNKDQSSTISGSSNTSGKKSVRIALGSEQTAV